MNNKNTEDTCCAGCKKYTGGEVRHLPECVFYPESLSRIYDEKDNTLTQYKEALREIIPLAERGMDDIRTLVSERELITKAKQLLNK